MKVYTARWVLPITRPSFENGAVAVDGGHIVFVGPASEAPEGEKTDLGECAVMPGLVNTHSHLELTAMRGWLEDPEGGIKGGMKVKVSSILRALENGVRDVHIIDGRTPHSVIAELFTDSGIGTLVKP